MVKVPTRGEWQRFHFRLYTLGCAGLVLLLGTPAALLVISGWQSETRHVLEPPPPPPTALEPYLEGKGPLSPAAAPTEFDDIFSDAQGPHADRTVTLDIATDGEIPATIAPLLKRRYKSFAEAYQDAAQQAPGSSVLLSVDALLEKAATIEEGVLLGLERLFVRGESSSDIMPLAHFLVALDQALVAAAAQMPGQAPSPTAQAEARAYLAVALRFLEAEAPVADEQRWSEAKQRFLAGRLLSEPRGLWGANEQRRREYHALRALMYPLDPQAALALHHALAHDAEEREGRLYAHYRRWLTLLETLYGYHYGPRTVADLLESPREPSGPVSLLPYRPHEPADAYVLAAEKAREAELHEQVGEEVAAVKLALARLVHEPQATTLEAHDANWRRMRLWARTPLLPGRSESYRKPHIAEHKLRTTTAYHRLRLTAQGPRWQEEQVRGFELFGRSMLGWRPRDESRRAEFSRRPPLASEPAPEVLYRLHYAAWALPELLHRSAELEAATLRRTPAIGASGRQLSESVLERLASARELFGSLYLEQAEQLGMPAKPLPGAEPSQAASAAAKAWLLEGGYREDVDLARDVRRLWPLGFTGSDAQVMLGIRGVTLQPLVLTVREDGDPTAPGTRHLALIAVSQRLLHASDTHVLPPQELWRFAAARLDADWLRALIP